MKMFEMLLGFMLQLAMIIVKICLEVGVKIMAWIFKAIGSLLASWWVTLKAPQQRFAEPTPHRQVRRHGRRRKWR